MPAWRRSVSGCAAARLSTRVCRSEAPPLCPVRAFRYSSPRTAYCAFRTLAFSRSGCSVWSSRRGGVSFLRVGWGDWWRHWHQSPWNCKPPSGRPQTHCATLHSAGGAAQGHPPCRLCAQQTSPAPGQGRPVRYRQAGIRAQAGQGSRARGQARAARTQATHRARPARAALRRPALLSIMLVCDLA